MNQIVCKETFFLLMLILCSTSSFKHFFHHIHNIKTRKSTTFLHVCKKVNKMENGLTECHQRHFIRNIIDQDIEKKKYNRIITRFPPEPNGFLHLGHSKSILLNFNLARDYGGQCHIRFDDTNPENESIDYMKAIIEDVKWLLEDSSANSTIINSWEAPITYTSDYFDVIFKSAQYLIRQGLAYIDHSSTNEMAACKGSLTKPGVASAYRDIDPEKSLEDFMRMSRGEYEEGKAPVLRAKIDMHSPNLVMRDPVLYRVRKKRHPMTGDKWKVYPMYDLAHPVSDALELVSHSLCTLEFADHRPLYEWILQNLEGSGLLPFSIQRPSQIEFSRLNIEHNVLSKRVLSQLVKTGVVDGWNDPRMLTVRAMRRKGIPAAAIRLFSDRIGISKSDSNLEYSVLDTCVREVLQETSPRIFAVLEPLKITVSNWPEDKVEHLQLPFFPFVSNQSNQNNGESDRKFRNVTFRRHLYIDRSDFREESDRSFYGLVPGGKVRLKYAYEVTCTKVLKNDKGDVIEVVVNYDEESRLKKGKVKGKLQWLDATTCVEARVIIFDSLFTCEHPMRDQDFTLNPESRHVYETSKIENCSELLTSDDPVQFERLGYFKIDSSKPRLVFNRVTPLRVASETKIKTQMPNHNTPS